MNKILVIIPTYNEAENIDSVMNSVLKATPDIDLLVVDDSSPDGTGKLVEKFKADHPRVSLLTRPVKDGLAGAYIAGFKWGLEKGYDSFVQMDADLSHSPQDVPRLIKALGNSDVAIGSRYMSGGGTSGWTLPRKMISRGGNIYAQTILGVPYKDLTGGFNAWKRTALEKVNLSTIKSKGYAYQVEMKYRAHKLGFKITEVPIHFQNRLLGYSKMSQDIVREAAFGVLKMRNSSFT